MSGMYCAGCLITLQPGVAHRCPTMPIYGAWAKLAAETSAGVPEAAPGQSWGAQGRSEVAAEPGRFTTPATLRDALAAQFQGACDRIVLGDLNPERGPAGLLAGMETRQTIDARKLSTVLHVPEEVLMDEGVIPDTRPPSVPLPWRTRLRWWWQAWRERAGRRLGSWLAGVELCDGDHA